MTSSKKANVVMDSIVLIIVVVVFGMVTLFAWQAFSEVNPSIQEDLTSAESITVMDDVNTRYPSIFDALFMLIFIGFWAAAVISGYVSDQHPMIFGFMMIAVIFVLIAGAMISNYFDETYDDNTLNNINESFPMTNFILTHLLEMGIAVALTTLLALMGKNRL